MIDSLKNTKHRILVSLLYSSGLRISEAVRLKVEDISFKEGIGLVKGGKGRKDRHFIISKHLLGEIKEFLNMRHYESPYLFPTKKGHIGARQAEKIVKLAAKKAGIKKRVFAHALRSSFATHLLDKGTDIRIIQELLGHSNLSTTQRYTKVSTKLIKSVKSPLDL
jgi:integrase/recombinase XerD